MRRLNQFAARLYPRWWRDRFGSEFDALLDDAQPGLAGTLDICKGAFKMQFSTFTPARLFTICSLAGILLALLASLFMQEQYRSISSVQLNGPGETAVSFQALQAFFQAEVLNDQSLATIISKNKLYQQEIARMPSADVVGIMRSAVQVILNPVARTIQIEFDYPDPLVAQRGTMALTGAFMDRYSAMHPNLGDAASASSALYLDLLDPPLLPEMPIFWSSLNIVLAGLVVGIVVAGLFLLGQSRRTSATQTSPRFWAPLGAFTLCTLVGFAGSGAAIYVPMTFTSSAIFQAGPTAMPDSSAAVAAIERRVPEGLLHSLRDNRLYPYYRHTLPVDSIVQMMRKDIRITPIQGEPAGRVRLEFDYHLAPQAYFQASSAGRSLAYSVTQSFAHDLTQSPNGSFTVLQYGSYTDTKYGFRRYAYLGAPFAGLILGSLFAYLRSRRNRPSSDPTGSSPTLQPASA